MTASHIPARADADGSPAFPTKATDPMRHLLLFPLLLASAAVRGQDSPAGRIAPFLTADTVAVARVDLARVDVGVAFDRLGPFLALSGNDVGALRRAAEAATGGLRKAGATEVFLILGSGDLPHGSPALVVSAPAGTDPQAVADALGIPKPAPDSGRVIEAKDGAIYIGPVAAHPRAGVGALVREGLAEAFAAADAPVQLVLAPSEDHRRALRETLPDLPPDFGGVTGEQLAAGLRWAALGVSFEPKLSARLVVRSESEQAAESLLAALTAGLRRLSTAPEVLRQFPPMPTLVGSLIPKREGDRLVLVADEAIDAAGKILGGLTATARAEAGKAQSMNHLKQLGLAFHNFADNWGSFPPSAGYAGEKPLLSWRVYLLPYLEQQALYQEFRLDEPWDSEHNRKLVERMPEVFKSPNVAAPAGHTAFLVPTGEGLTFGGREGLRLKDVTDGLSNTLLVVEAPATKAVPWTKPEDLAITPEAPLAGLVGGREAFAALIADGSARRFSKGIDAQEFLKLLTPAGGEVVDWAGVDRPE